MAEYSKFVAPDFAPIDWGKITGDIVDKLDKTEKEREEKRVALDKEYSTVVSKIDSFQGSKAPTFNQFIMNGANDIRDYLYEQNKLLKRGKLNPSDYSRIVSTVSDGWGRLADLTKGYDANFEEGMKRIQEGKAGAQEMYQRQITSELMNLKGKKTFINPNDGRLYIAKLNEKGEISGDQDLFDVQTLNAGLNQNVDKLILSTEVEKYTKTLGKEGRMVNGRYVVSQEVRKDFESKTKPKIISSILSDPNKSASVLLDNTNEGYRLEQNENYFVETQGRIDQLAKMKESTKSESDKKKIQSEINELSKDIGKTILLRRDENNIYTPTLSESQEKRAREVVGDIVKSQLDYITEKPESVGGMSYSESRDMQRDAKEAEKANKRVQEVKAITNPNSISKFKGEIIGQLADNAFPELKGYVVTDFKYSDGRYYFDLRKPLFDKNGNPLTDKRGKKKYDPHVVWMNPGEGVYNATNALLNQKRGTQYAWPDISPELAAAPTGNMGLNATAILNKNK